MAEAAEARPKVRGPQDRVTKMATNFDAVQWAQINAPQGSKRDFNADFVEAVETREGLRSGMSPNQSVMRGMRARQTALDPMFELKKSQAMLNIATTAQQFQQGILSSEIKRKQIDDEAADDLNSARIIKQFGGKPKEMLEALNSTFWKSARGIQNAVQMRLQLSELMDMDEVSQIYSKLDGVQRAQLYGLEKGSQEWMGKVRNFPRSQAAGSLQVDKEWLDSVRASGDATSIADAERMFKSKYPSLDERKAREMDTIAARAESSLSAFYARQEAEFESQAANLESSGTERDKQDAAALRAQAKTFKDKRASLGSGTAATTSVAPATNAAVPSVNFIFKDGKLVPAP